jgi:hypothetical protein
VSKAEALTAFEHPNAYRPTAGFAVTAVGYVSE